MLQNYNKWKVLQQFFKFPLSELQLREISRNIKLSLPSVKNYLVELEKEGFILKKRNRVQGYPIYIANRDYQTFLFYKKIDTLERINDLKNDLYDEFLPESIILFGSASRGEDTEESDVDIFIGCKQGKFDLSKYEQKINRKINLFFEPNFKRLSNELRNNLLNGITLKGYIKVF
jgi:predicted nucleotidyltransferase